jgi:hypothetical protein
MLPLGGRIPFSTISQSLLGAQLIRAKERRQCPGHSVGSQTRATMSMAWLTESEEVALQKVTEIRALRKKGLREDEIAKRLTLAGAICS